jgi:hypothetical protein
VNRINQTLEKFASAAPKVAALATVFFWLTLGSGRLFAQGGTWTKITNPFPGYAPGKALLLTDGSVLVQEDSKVDWYKLTPDIYGNYISGTWTKVAAIPSTFHYAPEFYASAVLPDGRVIIAGGEYNNNGPYTNGVVIYDPIANSWTSVDPPGFGDTCGKDGSPGKGTFWCGIGDAPSVVLPDGTFMLGGNFKDSNGYVTKVGALLPPPYNPSVHPWIPTGTNHPQFAGNDETGWTLMPSRVGDVAQVTDPPGLVIDDLAVVLTVDTYRGNCWNCPPPTICGPGTPSPVWNLGGGKHSSELYLNWAHQPENGARVG